MKNFKCLLALLVLLCLNQQKLVAQTNISAGQTIKATITNPLSNDRIEFCAEKGDNMVFIMASEDIQTVKLELYTLSATLLDENISPNFARINFVAPEDGCYFLLTSSNFNDEIGEYEVSAQILSPEKTATIDCGVPIKSEISNNTTMNSHSFEVSAGSVIKIETNNTLDHSVEIYNSIGNLLERKSSPNPITFDLSGFETEECLTILSKSDLSNNTGEITLLVTSLVGECNACQELEPPVSTQEECGDGIDNDQDGSIDEDCQIEPVNPPTDITTITIGSVQGFPNSIVRVPVFIDYSCDSINSFSLAVAKDGQGFNALGLESQYFSLDKLQFNTENYQIIYSDEIGVSLTKEDTAFVMLIQVESNPDSVLNLSFTDGVVPKSFGCLIDDRPQLQDSFNVESGKVTVQQDLDLTLTAKNLNGDIRY